MSRGLTRGDQTVGAQTGDENKEETVEDQAAVENKPEEETQGQAEEGGHGGHGGEIPMPSLMAPVAPLQTGYTAKAQPVLQFYLSGAWPEKIEFTLNKHGVVEPVLEKEIDGPSAEGIWQINLADYNITLEPGAEYEWFIAIVPDPAERSADFLGSATVMYVAPPEELSKRLAEHPKEEAYRVYADAGYWYDSLESLCGQIKSHPENETLRAHRIALFDQVKLGKVMDYDKKLVSKH